MRGKVPDGGGHPARTGITPAYAGKSAYLLKLLPPDEDHPRVCGEKTKKIP